MVVNLVAGLWALAEATLFFIVPDVWLSLAGRRRLQTGLTACLFALGGALLGGALIYGWGLRDQAGATALMEKLPAISPAMVARVQDDLTTHGALAIVFGPLSGTPYKLYAAQAGEAGIGFVLFMLVSVPARGIRFVLVTAGVHYALRLMASGPIARHPVVLILIAWTLFYLFYFAMMPG